MSDQPTEGRAGDAVKRFSSSPDELVGRVLDGRYQIEEVLGRGAMGVVLAARHVFLDRKVAVKMLHPSMMLVDEMRARFVREAQASSQVQHEGIVSVSDFGVTDEGLHYLVMEHLEGEDLYAWSSARGALPPSVVAHIAVQVCDALEVLHAAGWVHRDLKPENLWVMAGSPDEAPRVKVLDLGIAAAVDGGDDAPGKARLTRTGHTLGTAHYMSPEQALAEPLDGRSDLYSLGCVLWELATGECTFDGTSHMAVMMQHMSKEPAAPSTLNAAVPLWLDRAILRCLAKRPDRRFATAAAARAAFEEGLETTAKVVAADRGAGAAAARLRSAETGTSAALELAGGRRRRGWMASAAALLAVGAIAVWALTSGGERRVEGLGGPVMIVSDDGPGVETGTGAGSVAGAETAAATKTDAATAEASKTDAATAEAAGAEAGEDQGATPRVERATLTFLVQPKGARVTRDGEDLGVTPLVLEVPAEDVEHTYTFSHRGRVTLALPVSHASDERVARTLARAPRATPKTARDPEPAPAEPAPADPTPKKPSELMRPALPGGAP